MRLVKNKPKFHQSGNGFQLNLTYPVVHFSEIFVNPMTGQVLLEGDVFIWPNLATTLRQIATDGASAFYSGKVAHELVEDLKKVGSIITLEDLANYRYVSFSIRFNVLIFELNDIKVTMTGRWLIPYTWEADDLARFQTLYKTNLNFGQFGCKPWSIVDWRRQTLKRLWVWIPALDTGCTYFTLYCCNVCLKNIKNKLKMRPGMAHLSQFLDLLNKSSY